MGAFPFLAFINDLPEVTKLSDDCLLYRQINSIQDMAPLQQDICFGEMGNNLANAVSPTEMYSHKDQLKQIAPATR